MTGSRKQRCSSELLNYTDCALLFAANILARYLKMIFESLFPFLVAAAFVVPVASLTPAGWRAQSIYQVMTDRFARTDLSTTASCDSSRGVYCGGTWRGLISKLDYIQGMGFTAIWISPFVEQISGDTTDGSSYHVRRTWLLELLLCLPLDGARLTIDDLGLLGTRHIRSQLSLRHVWRPGLAF